MRTCSRRRRAVLAGAAAAALPTAAALAAGTSFTNDAPGVFTAPANATTNVGTISGTGTTAIVGGATVLVADAVNQGALNMSGGGTLTLDTTNTSTVTSANLYDATLGGSAPDATTVQATPTVLNVTGALSAGNLNLRTGLVLNISGVGTELGNNIAGDANTIVNVAAGGSLTYGGASGLFVSVPLNNAGLVQATGVGGQVQVLAGGNQSGTFNVSAGSYMAVNGTFTAASVVNNSGTFDLSRFLPAGNTFGGTLNSAAGGTLLLDGTTTVLSTAVVNIANGTTLGDAVTAQGVTFNNNQVMNFGAATLSGIATFNNPGLSFTSLTYGQANPGGGDQLTLNTNSNISIGTLTQTSSQLQASSGTTLFASTLNLSGGALRANVFVSDLFSFTGGAIDGGDGTQGSVTVLSGGTLNTSGGGTLTRGGKLTVQPSTVTNATAGLVIGSGSTTGFTSALTIQNTAVVNVAGTLAIGNNGNVSSGSGSGLVTVQPGGILNVNGLALLGNTNGGDGTLIVQGKATALGLNLNDVEVMPGGTLNVPSGSTAGLDPEVAGSLVGGYQRDGTLNVSGGTVTSPRITLGVTGGYTGTYMQSGGTVTTTTFAAGNNGNASGGAGVGMAMVTGGMLNAGTVLLGSTAGGSGTLTVSGGGAVNVQGGVQLGTVGVGTGGSLTVSAGGAPAGEDPALADAIVGGYQYNGTLNVSGGAVVTPLLTLGVTGGYTGTYAQTGGTVTAGVMRVGNNGNASSGAGVGMAMVTGGMLNAGTIMMGSTMGGSGTLIVSGGGSVNVEGGVLLDNLQVAAGGTLVVNADGAPAGEDPVLFQAVVGGYLHDGTLNVSGGSTTTPNLKLGLTGGNTGRLVQVGGTLAVTQVFGIGNDGNASSGAGTGVASVTGGTLRAGSVVIGSSAGGVGTLSVRATGRVTVSGTTAVRSAGSSVALSAGGVLATGALDLGGVASRLNWTGGMLLVEGTGSDLGGPQTVPNGATLGGTGTIANAAAAITVAGTVAPGADVAQVGTLTTGSQVWPAAGTLAVDVASTDGRNVSSADLLVLSGLTISATANGKFAVAVTGLGSNPGAPTVPVGGRVVLADDPADPAATNPFSPANRSATLAKLALTASGVNAPAGDGLALDTASDGSAGYELVLTAAPEPASLLLVAMAAAPVALRRRRR